MRDNFLKMTAQWIIFFDGANFLPKTGAVAFKLSSTVPRWRSCDGAKMLAEKRRGCAVVQS